MPLPRRVTMRQLVKIPGAMLSVVLLALLASPNAALAQANADAVTMLLVPSRVFDAPAGVMHEGWAVLVRGDRIVAVGPRASVVAPPGARQLLLPNATLLPGLIEGHGHLFLHPYIET